MFMGSWPVYIIRKEYPRYMALYIDSVSEDGMIKNRVFCPHLCPLDYQCPLWRKPICASKAKAVAFVVPEPEDEDMPFRIFFEWEAARDYALSKAKRIREREETLYYYFEEKNVARAKPSLEPPV
jgi:hypothetical protein